MRGVGVLFGVGALAVASLPPFGPFLGKTLVDDAALGAGGYDWVPAVMVAVSALTGGALLRVALRVFFGLGRPAPEDPHSAGAEPGAGDERAEDEAAQPAATVPVLLWGPALALLAASLAWGVWPGVLDSVGRAAERFVDGAAYADAVLRDSPPPAVTSPLHAPAAGGYAYAAASVVGAVAVAIAALAGVRDRAPGAGLRALEALRALHSGRPGDYAAWTAAGVALLGGLVALAVG
jgi:multicomponent Na+:H+ antiporter subunit D